jgi:hypothetical protein
LILLQALVNAHHCDVDAHFSFDLTERPISKRFSFFRRKMTMIRTSSLCWRTMPLSLMGL